MEKNWYRQLLFGNPLRASIEANQVKEKPLLAPSEASQLKDMYPSKIRLYREFFDIIPGMQLETFWKNLNGDQGPGAVLYVLGKKLLVFDCVGFPKGHFHAMIGHSVVKGKNRQHRIHLPETSIEAQVTRCAFEIKWNLRYYMQRHWKAQVQHFDVDNKTAQHAAELMKQKLLEYCTSMPNRFAQEPIALKMPESQAWNERLESENLS